MKKNAHIAEVLKTVYLSSPVGLLEIRASSIGLRSVLFVESARFDESLNEYNALTMNQLEQYFGGSLKSFDIALDLDGTNFQKKIWTLLLDIPFGKTVSYNDISRQYGDLKAIRAVAAANGANKIAIIIPCHRVIGSDGSLTGYAGGLPRKRWLLDFENPPTQTTMF